MKRKLLLLCAPLFLFFFCGCYRQNKPDQELLEINMNEYERIDFNELIQNISCIKLESENVPGFDFCRRMVRYKDHFYLLTGNEVFIYNYSGKFIKRIVFNHPDILFLSTLRINPDPEELWVISNHTILNKYDVEGNLIHRSTLIFPCVDLVAVDKQEFLVYDGRFNREWDYSIALTDFTSIHKFFLPKERKLKNQYIPQSMFTSDSNSEKTFIVFPDRDTIYYYDQQTQEINPYYHINFQGDFLTEEIYPEKGFSDEEMAEIINQRQYITALYSFYQTAGRLFFKLSGKREDFCTINLQDHSLQTFDRLFDDYLPTMYNPFVCSDETHLYCLVKEKDLVEHYQTNECTFPAIRELLPFLSLKGNHQIILDIKVK